MWECRTFCSDGKITEVELRVVLEKRTNLSNANMVCVCDTCSLDRPICRSQSGDHIYINCWLSTSSGRGCLLADITTGVVKQRTYVVSWCGALTNSCSANNCNKLSEVGGVLIVVIHRSKCLFCKLGPNLSKFHKERNALAVAVIWINGKMDCSLKDYSVCTFYYI